MTRELVPCVDGNDKKRQNVSANIFSTNNIFKSSRNQQEDQNNWERKKNGLESSKE